MAMNGMTYPDYINARKQEENARDNVTWQRRLVDYAIASRNARNLSGETAAGLFLGSLLKPYLSKWLGLDGEGNGTVKTDTGTGTGTDSLAGGAADSSDAADPLGVAQMVNDVNNGIPVRIQGNSLRGNNPYGYALDPISGMAMTVKDEPQNPYGTNYGEPQGVVTERTYDFNIPLLWEKGTTPGQNGEFNANLAEYFREKYGTRPSTSRGIGSTTYPFF